MSARTSPRAQDEWPEKRPGQHRWVAMIAYTLSPSQARALADGAIVNLGDRVDSVIGCYDCDQPYLTARGKPCRADAKPTRPVKHEALLTSE